MKTPDATPALLSAAPIKIKVDLRLIRRGPPEDEFNGVKFRVEAPSSSHGVWALVPEIGPAIRLWVSEETLRSGTWEYAPTDADAARSPADDTHAGPMPAAQMGEIRARASEPLSCATTIAYSAGEAKALLREATRDRAALLAHLDALTQRAVDGEALGREARASHMDWSEDTASVWPFLTEKVRGDYCRTAIHVHAIGYAARASEGEAERAESAKLALFVNTALADECAALRAIAADPKAHAAEAVAQEKALHDLEVEGLDVTIARLTAELDATRADAATDRLLCQAATDHVRDREEMITLLREQVDERDASLRTETTMKEQVQDQLVEMRGKHREAWERAERLTAELAEARAAVEAFRALPGYPHTEGVTPAMVKLRLEANGAQKEREAIVERVRRLAAEGAPGMPEDGDETLVDWIATQIEARATEGRQG